MTEKRSRTFAVPASKPEALGNFESDRPAVTCSVLVKPPGLMRQLASTPSLCVTGTRLYISTGGRTQGLA